KGTLFRVRLPKGKSHLAKDEIIKDLLFETVDGSVEQRTTDRRNDERRREERRMMSSEDKAAISLLQVQLSDLVQGGGYISQYSKDDRKKDILVVEDNRDLASNIAMSLADGYNVTVAYNGREGLEAVNKKTPDLIISDVMMPEMDGHELLIHIKEDERTRHIPFILLTAKASLEDKVDSLKHGADQYLAKPFNPKELNAVVESLLSSRELQAELNIKNIELADALQQIKDAQAQLVHTAKMASVGQLAAGMAHEINTPLFVMNNCLEMIEEEASRVRQGSNVPDITQAFSKAKKMSARIQGIIDSLLSFSRKDQEGMSYVDIHEGIDDTLVMLEHQFKDKIQVHKEYGEIQPIQADLQQLNQVFMNLLSNAVHAIKARDDKKGGSGNIWINTSSEEGFVTIIVKDDGAGMPAEVAGKVFDPFFTTKNVGEGTGLGLTISHRIVKEHGGTIDVKSEQNAGTLFVVKLPLHQKQLERMESNV
ncbi:MAG: response regulator, partial [Pseudomonadota bacterium]